MIGETAVNRRRSHLNGCDLEHKLALTIVESLEWSKSKLNLICSRVVDPYSFFTDPDPDPVDPDGGQYGSGSGSNPDPGL
jgi:hypothetical protein